MSDPADLGDLGRLSRVLLEPVMFRAMARGHDATADAIWTELAGRTWQNVNPYAGSRPR